MPKSPNIRNLLLLTSFSSTSLALSYFGYNEIKKRDSTIIKDNLKISFATHPKNPKLLLSPFTSKDGSHYCGEDAFVIGSFHNNQKNDSNFIIGIADGVGSWTKKGIDAGHFSRALMKEVGLYHYDFNDDKDLISVMSSSFQSLHNNLSSYSPKPFGSSTCCLVSIKDSSFCSANLGDSGFMLIRDGKVLNRSISLQSRFNCPFQLTMVPTHLKGISNSNNDFNTIYRSGDPTKSSLLRGDLKKGDVLIMGTDGLWDNLWDSDILSILSKNKNGDDTNLAAIIADSSLKASLKERSFEDGPSPFGYEAIKQGVPDAKELYWNGKRDDITVITVEYQ